MRRYKIFYGLGGGFGGAKEDSEIYEFENEEEAEEYAWQMACEKYDSYAGLYGLVSFDEILEIYEDEEEAEEVYNDRRESWLDYWVEEVDIK